MLNGNNMKEIIGSTKSGINFEIYARPDDTSCSPACLQALYAYYNDNVNLDNRIGEVQTLEGGAPLLSFCDAMPLREDAGR